MSDYARRMILGDEFPPIGVVYDGTEYWLWDGFHRMAAAKQAGLATIAAELTEGTWRDALLLSVGANKVHGQRRWWPDAMRAAVMLLQDEEWGAWPDDQIAKLVGIGASEVAELRRSHPRLTWSRLSGGTTRRLVRRAEAAYDPMVGRRA
ncbi:hypothetical protein [Tuwongella immobilis]|uniref:hypothetical protein n=1 Tax=Tuwongella immobilis TaxID=692036 RepID=UPI0013A6F6EA|nr:hypothetical protein [Tuwongella immobilis]